MSNHFDPDPVTSSEDLVPGLGADDGRAPFPGAAPSGRFDLVLRGYDRRQVDDHVEHLTASLAELRTELAEVTEREAAAVRDAERARAELERGRPGFDALGERVAQILGLAEVEATQLRDDAQRDAARLRDDAQREVDAQLSGVRAEAERIREEAAREAAELRAEARQELAELDRARVEVLAEISSMRDTLSGIITGASAPRPVAVAEPAGAEAPMSDPLFAAEPAAPREPDPADIDLTTELPVILPPDDAALDR
jgi:hypothetical protein